MPRGTRHLVIRSSPPLLRLPRSAFESSTALESLDLSNNEIEAIHPDAFRGLERLKRLHLAYNKLSRDQNATFVRSLLHLLRLRKLYLTSNGFSFIPPIASASLSKLNLDANHLTSAKFPKSFTKCTNLASLVLASNQIVRIDSSDFEHLKGLPVKSLDLTRNRLEAIDSTAFLPLLTKLNTLSLNRNQLTAQALEAALKNFAHKDAVLLGLSVEANPLDRLDKRLLASLGHLLSLNLDSNKFRIVEKGALRSFAPSLQRLSLNHCSLNDSSLAGLQLQNMTHLTYLSLHNNRLTAFPPYLPPSLRQLDLHDNDLTHLLSSHRPPVSLPELWELNLKANDITSIAPKGLLAWPALKVLDLAQNKLYKLPREAFYGLFSLDKLILDHQQNPLSLIDPKALSDARNLEHLELADNDLGSQLSSVTEAAMSPFQGLRHLKRLDLARNDIEWVHPTLFAEAESLQQLDLSGNRLPLVNISLLPRSVNHLVLIDNPLRCACQWLSAASQRRVAKVKRTLCAAPPSEAGKSIDKAAVHKRCVRKTMTSPPRTGKATSGEGGGEMTSSNKEGSISEGKYERPSSELSGASPKKHKGASSGESSHIGKKIKKEAKNVVKKALKALLYGKLNYLYFLTIIPGVALLFGIYKCYKKKRNRRGQPFNFQNNQTEEMRLDPLLGDHSRVI